MTIRIRRNPSGNCVEFVGSSLPAYYNYLLRAQLNVENPNRVDILNDARSGEKGNTEFEFFALDFADYSDDAGVVFTSAQAMVDYFNVKARALGYTTDDGVDLTGLDIDFQIDATETTVLLSIGEYLPVNVAKAVADDDGTIHIYILSDGTPINGIESEAERYKGLDHTTVTIDGVLVGGDIHNVVNALNALFYQTGNADGAAPTINSPSSITLNEGDPLSFSLDSDKAVEFEWIGLPNDVAVSTLNRRKLVGGSQLTAGTYNFSVKAYNYYGETTANFTLTVVSVMTPNTRSVDFANKDYGRSTNSGLQSILQGTTWSVHTWFKPGTGGNSQQVLYSYGDDWYLFHRGNNGQLRFVADEETWRTADNVVTDGVWHHIVLVYIAAGPLLYVDGSSVSWTSSGNISGVDSFAVGQNFNVGRRDGGKYLRGSRIDELAVFNNDQSANVSSLYNGGSTQDLSLLTDPPEHWWRMGDGDTFPTIQDNSGTADLTLFNMTAADIVTDAP